MLFQGLVITIDLIIKAAEADKCDRVKDIFTWFLLIYKQLAVDDALQSMGGWVSRRQLLHSLSNTHSHIFRINWSMSIELLQWILCAFNVQISILICITHVFLYI